MNDYPWGARRVALLTLVIIVAVACTSDVSAQSQGFGRKNATPKAPIIKEDIKYIRCQVCDAMVRQQLHAVKELRAALKPGQKLTEAAIMDVLEKMCDPDEDEGDWITQLDIVEDGPKLLVVDTGSMSDCNSECRTIAKTCDELQNKVDLTDVSEALYLGKKQRAAFMQWQCYDEAGVCGKKVPPVPQDRKAGPKHKPIDEGAVSRKKMLRKMKASGMSGTMYDRESMMDEMAMMREAGLDDDEIEELKSMPRESADGSQGQEDPATAAEGDAAALQGPSGLARDIKKAAGAFKEGAAKVADVVGSAAAGAAAAVGSAASSAYDRVKETVLGSGRKAEL